MSEKVFPEGLRIEPPRENAPSFVKGRVGINVAKFGQWLVANADGRGWVNLDLLESKEGKLYMAMNKFKPETVVPGSKFGQPRPKSAPRDDDDMGGDSIPF